MKNDVTSYRVSNYQIHFRRIKVNYGLPARDTLLDRDIAIDDVYISLDRFDQLGIASVTEQQIKISNMELAIAFRVEHIMKSRAAVKGQRFDSEGVLEAYYEASVGGAKAPYTGGFEPSKCCSIEQSLEYSHAYLAALYCYFNSQVTCEIIVVDTGVVIAAR